MAEEVVAACGEGIELGQRAVPIEGALAEEGIVAPDGADFDQASCRARLQIQQQGALDASGEVRVEGQILDQAFLFASRLAPPTLAPDSYTHLTLTTTKAVCSSRG